MNERFVAVSAFTGPFVTIIVVIVGLIIIIIIIIVIIMRYLDVCRVLECRQTVDVSVTFMKENKARITFVETAVRLGSLALPVAYCDALHLTFDHESDIKYT